MADLLDYPDVDRGSQLAATYIAGCTISFVFVAMRLCARYSIAGVGIDDWCMLITWIVFLPLTIIVSILSFSGGTRHSAYLELDPVHQTHAIKMNYIAQPLCIFCLGTGKIAVAFLIVRLLNRASLWRRWSLYLASGLTAINTIIMIILTFAQCEKPAALWDGDLRKKTKCWDPSIQSSFSIYGASLHAAMDFFLALLPVTLVWGLKTDRRKRIALCGLLGCGSLTGICAAVKASKLVSLNARSDITWETFSLFMWTGIEIILSIVCGSIPALKPIYAICIGRRPMSIRSSQKRTHGTGASGQFHHSRRSYVRKTESDDTLALGHVGSTSTAEAERVSEDEIGLAVSMAYEKPVGGIHVTRTVEIA